MTGCATADRATERRIAAPKPVILHTAKLRVVSVAAAQLREPIMMAWHWPSIEPRVRGQVHDMGHGHRPLGLDGNIGVHLLKQPWLPPQRLVGAMAGVHPMIRGQRGRFAPGMRSQASDPAAAYQQRTSINKFLAHASRLAAASAQPNEGTAGLKRELRRSAEQAQAGGRRRNTSKKDPPGHTVSTCRAEAWKANKRRVRHGPASDCHQRKVHVQYIQASIVV